MHPSCQTLERLREFEDSACCKTAFRSTRMQSAQSQPKSRTSSASVLWSACERRFALLEESVNGLRFAPLSSQKVVTPPRRRAPRCASTALTHRTSHCEGGSCCPSSHFSAGRRMLRPGMFQSVKFVRFGHQRPNPSVEGTAKRLRLLSAPHLER